MQGVKLSQDKQAYANNFALVYRNQSNFSFVQPRGKLFQLVMAISQRVTVRLKKRFVSPPCAREKLSRVGSQFPDLDLSNTRFRDHFFYCSLAIANSQLTW